MDDLNFKKLLLHVGNFLRLEVKFALLHIVSQETQCLYSLDGW